MNLSRRDFLKATGLSGVGLALASLGLDVGKVEAAAKEYKLTGGREFTSVCHFCGCGCGTIGYVKDGKLINLEGAADAPVNRGGLCPKGVGYGYIPNSTERPKSPMYRAPGSDHWEEISWEEAIDRAARAMKKARDENWIGQDEANGYKFMSNRTDAIGFVGGSQVNNEECYQLIKMARALGVVFIDNQTRVCHATTPPALNAAFGRGAMTGSWYNLKHAKMIWIEGSNMAECHPMAMKNVMEAKDNGAIIVHVDVRYTRTSRVADHFFQLRPGTDIAFLGALINYIIQNKKYDADYLRRNTNAYCLLRDDYKFDAGIFSGYNEKTRTYDKTTWGYKVDANGKPVKALSMAEPGTVMDRLAKHFSRYTFEKASAITGMPVADIKKAAELFSSITPTVMMYALGMTQHTIGVENIRCFTIIQLLMGNIGVSGGGIDAMRGQPNVQSSTDYGIMFQYYPAYLSYPTHTDDTLAKWTHHNGTFRAKFLKNLLKAWFGDAANASNDYMFNALPIRNGTHNDSMYIMFEKAMAGIVKCIYVCGQNPQMTNANLTIVNKGLKNLDTLIVQDVFVNETAAFWERPGDNPADIKTEVIFLPAGSYLERCGSMTNSMRMLQWRMKGPDPVNDSRPDYWICDKLWKRIVSLYKDSTDPKDNTIKLLTWNYGDPEANGEAYVENIMKECNGYDLKDGHLLRGIREIRDDGTTMAGMWIFTGVFGDGVNMTKRRGQEDRGDMGIYPNYAWVWPDNIHMLYNRASCDENGKPVRPGQKLVWWDEEKGMWDGYDVPDVADRTQGPNTPGGQKPFRMNAEGFARLFAAEHSDVENGETRDHSYVPVDGPMPEFYEPVESPTKNMMNEGQKTEFNPCVIYPRIPELQKIGTPDEYPYVLCSSSLTEHWCSGTITRNIPYLNELVKEPFVEISEQLATKLGIRGGDRVRVSTTRSAIEVKAMVTKRAQPLMVNGKETHMIWMPYNWGFKGLSKGPSTNYLTIDALDPNVQEQEFKACLANVERL